jgi:hypothetical protein
MGGFRYCLGCRLDYDALASGATQAAAGSEPAWPDPDDARRAILAPGIGVAPERVLAGHRRRLPRRAASGWVTHAVASLGIVALIGMAFGSTGLIPLGVAKPSADPVGSGATPPSPIGLPRTAGGFEPTDVATTSRPGGPAAGPPAQPTTRPSRPAPRVVASPVRVTVEGVTLRGVSGTSTWTALAFEVTEARLRWSATSSAADGCLVRWTLERPDATSAKGQLRVRGTATGTGERTVNVKRGRGRLTVETDCASWSLVMAGRAKASG